MNITLDTLNDIDELMQWRAEVLTEVSVLHQVTKCLRPTALFMNANRPTARTLPW